MKTILTIIIVAMITFTISAYSTFNAPVYNHQVQVSIVHKKFAQDKLNMLFKCKAYTDHLNVMANELIELGDTESGTTEFVTMTKEYSTKVNNDLSKYYNIVIKNLSKQEAESLSDTYVGLYLSEANIISNYITINPTPTVEYANSMIRILDMCTKNNSHI